MSDQTKSKFVCILTQYFYPDLPGTAKIAKDLAFGFAKSGFRVDVYTGSPAYSSVNDTSKQLLIDDVMIHRAYSPNLSRKGIISRLINGFLVASSVSLKLFFKRHDIIIVDSTSPFLLTIASFIRLVKKTPYIVLVHDVYPDIAIKLGVVSDKSILAVLWKKLYCIVYRCSSKIVVLGSRMQQIVGRDLNLSDKAKIVIIPNWVDGSAITPAFLQKNDLKKQLGFHDAFVIIYSGNMGLTHDIDTILKSAEKMLYQPKIKYLLIGGGGMYEQSVKFVSDKGLNNVKILPYQPEDIFPQFLGCADASLVTLADGIEGLSVPSKIYSSLAAGLPVIGVLNEGSEIADIIVESECGYRTPPGNVDMLVDVISRLYCNSNDVERMSINARREFELKYSREIGVDKHINLVSLVLSENIKHKNKI